MKIITSVVISEKTRELIEALARKWGESRSAAVERCVQVVAAQEKSLSNNRRRK
jgi:hypothetical protein